jgi:Bacterial cell division membrane protein
MEKIKKQIKNFDFIIFIIMILLICVGLYCIWQIGIVNIKMKDLFGKQLFGAAVGCVIVLCVLFIDYSILSKLSVILYPGMLLLLAYLLLFGKAINNVKRWIVIVGIQLQPSELTKLVMILFLAFLCNYFKEKLNKLYVLFILAAVTAIPILLIVAEPHLSSGIAIAAIFCIIIYASGIPYKIIATALAIVIPLALALIIGVGVFNLKLPLIKSYHVNRILTFFSSDEKEDEGGKYQQNQAVASIASGGIHGKLIASEQEDKKYTNIYAKESDFVFSVVGEEFGFIGSAAIIVLYGILVLRSLIISTHSPDYVGKLICMGASAYIMFQVFVNIGVATNLLPNTGLPLPFISYGLTSLVSSMTAVGLILNVGMRRRN